MPLSDIKKNLKLSPYHHPEAFTIEHIFSEVWHFFSGKGFKMAPVPELVAQVPRGVSNSLLFLLQSIQQIVLKYKFHYSLWESICSS